MSVVLVDIAEWNGGGLADIPSIVELSLSCIEQSRELIARSRQDQIEFAAYRRAIFRSRHPPAAKAAAASLQSNGIMKVDELAVLGEAATILAQFQTHPDAVAAAGEAAGLAGAAIRILLDHALRSHDERLHDADAHDRRVPRGASAVTASRVPRLRPHSP